MILISFEWAKLGYPPTSLSFFEKCVFRSICLSTKQGRRSSENFRFSIAAYYVGVPGQSLREKRRRKFVPDLLFVARRRRRRRTRVLQFSGGIRPRRPLEVIGDEGRVGLPEEVEVQPQRLRVVAPHAVEEQRLAQPREPAPVHRPAILVRLHSADNGSAIRPFQARGDVQQLKI